MVNYQDDPHIRRLLRYSEELARRSEEVCAQFERLSARLASLLEYDDQRNQDLDEFLAQNRQPGDR